MSFRPEIARAALFERLARGHAERIVVLTPNHRLAQALESDFDREQLSRGLASWEAPDIVAFERFVERTYEEALYCPGASALPALLTPDAAQVLWEEAVAAGEWREKVLSVAATAALAAEAWGLAHDWRLESALDTWPGNEDGEAFAAWRSHYLRRMERDRLVDGPRLAGAVAALLTEGRVAAPATLALYAFDLVTMRQADFFERCERAGITVLACSRPRAEAKVTRVSLESPRQELETAAQWARARLEAGSATRVAQEKPGAAKRQGELFAEAPPSRPPPRIAVVVPDLQKRRAEVVRVFSRALGPQGFNVSLAPRLSAAPLVDAALLVLEISAAPIAFDRASRLLRSPFVAGAEAEIGARARLDVLLRRAAPATISLVRLRGLVAEAGKRRGATECTRLAEMLDRLLDAARDASRASPQDWARRFTAQLDAVGFPGERTLDSGEFQTLAKWREVLAEFAALGCVAPVLSGNDARARVHRLATETTFQPASGAAPVQVLGLLESSGLGFDHLWVSGLTEDTWPVPTRPQPLIPLALQRKAGVPQATPERSLAFDAGLTAAWREAAPEVVFSRARADGDRELLVSALVADVAESSVDALAIPSYPTRRDALFAAGRAPGAVTTRADHIGPPVGAVPARGGTGILVDQAACPFRAFAHFRLGARELDRPEPGLGPPERGQLLHAMMARLWGDLKDHATLVATDAATLESMIAAAAAHAVDSVRTRRPGRLDGRFAELERERLAGIAREWLRIETARAPFEVVTREAPLTLSAGSLRLEGRVDRMDRLADGGVAIIDYKSGSSATTASWLGKRPDDCQLPLYALAAVDGDVRAVAFARLKVGKLGFAGFAREPGLLPDVGLVDRHPTARKLNVGSWDSLIASWREQTARLGEDFAAGSAGVDPKNMLATCERCDLQPLCRVHERIGTLDEGDPFAEETE